MGGRDNVSVTEEGKWPRKPQFGVKCWCDQWSMTLVGSDIGGGGGGGFLAGDNKKKILKKNLKNF